MTISKWVSLVYAAAAILIFILLDKSFEWIGISLLNPNFFDYEVLGSYVRVRTVAALVGAIGATFYAYRRADVFAYLSEVIMELKRVTWPSLDETRRSTIVVIVFTILLSTYLATFDYIWKLVTDFIISPGA
ncbi:MAG: preprotein translocase subunit SecE [Myxococcota bacterium]|jgi:preprotein translocase subunit SecE|nr:preprotein translocase subunit SecE [Myxococcota bacterium]MEC9441940.1 preprotein translocase subunit SecE [Myxococcota bacterium]